MRTPLFAVTGAAVDLLVGTVAGNDGVKCLGAIPAFETFAVPFAAFGEHHFSSKHNASATGTPLAWSSLDLADIYGCRSRGVVTLKMAGRQYTILNWGNLFRIKNARKKGHIYLC